MGVGISEWKPKKYISEVKSPLIMSGKKGHILQVDHMSTTLGQMPHI